jgi:AcrR family transcriptional regulator
MPRPKKSQSGNLREEILATAWQQIAEEGASALSLRGIARQLSITAPAIYNYFPRRDDLVTELIIDAFLSFGDAQIAALQAIPTGDHTGRLRALGLAYRQWAVSYPQRYMLIFGAPIPGYAAPAERTTPAAARALDVLVGVLADAHRAGRLALDPGLPLTPAVQEMMAAWQVSRAPGIDLRVLAMALSIWGWAHGLVMLEIGNQYPPFVASPGELYRYDLERIVRGTVR